MKRLLLLCVILALLLSACGQTSETPTTTASPELTTLAPTESTTEEQTTEVPVTAVPGKTQFTVTKHQLIPPKQSFDAEFEAFYKEFTAAVSKKDMAFIDSILDEGIMSSFGGDPTKDFFYEHWETQREHYDRELWDVLEAIIALGGVYDQTKKSFTAPYIFTDFKNTDLDAYEYFAIIEKSVSVYENESVNSKVIDALDYSILEFHHNQEFWEKKAEDFVSVTTLSGSAGFIQRKHLRSPIDYRLCIEQKDGQWKLLWLIAGD